MITSRRLLLSLLEAIIARRIAKAQRWPDDASVPSDPGVRLTSSTADAYRHDYPTARDHRGRHKHLILRKVQAIKSFVEGWRTRQDSNL